MPGPEELFKQKQQQNQIFKTTDEIQYKHSFKNPFDNNPFDNNIQVKKPAKTTDNITTDEQEKEIFKNKLENVVSDHDELQKTWNKVEDNFDFEVLQNRMAEFNLFRARHTSKENAARLKKTLEENHPDLFKGIKSRKVTELKYRPERSVLVKTFAAEFRDVVTHEERLKKQRNKRSELHRKLVNKEAINNSEENVMNSRMDMLTKVIDSSQVIPEAQELSDLACFMTGIEAEDQRLAEEFL
nr:hypothetical protein [Lachnospiraceae bacterium]